MNNHDHPGLSMAKSDFDGHCKDTAFIACSVIKRFANHGIPALKKPLWTTLFFPHLTHRMHILEANGQSFRLGEAKKRLKNKGKQGLRKLTNDHTP
jgi:hypothetical protein